MPTGEDTTEYQARMRFEYQRANDELRRLQADLDQAHGVSEVEYEERQRKVTAQLRLVAEISECLR